MGLSTIVSISCDESVHREFYKIANNKQKGETNGDIFLKMIQAYNLLVNQKELNSDQKQAG